MSGAKAGLFGPSAYISGRVELESDEYQKSLGRARHGIAKSEANNVHHLKSLSKSLPILSELIYSRCAI